MFYYFDHGSSSKQSLSVTDEFEELFPVRYHFKACYTKLKENVQLRLHKLLDKYWR
jgi:hypothetical protein